MNRNDDVSADRLLCTVWLDTERLCKTCGKMYKERSNLGLHLCSIHPEEYSARNSNMSYKCCGRRSGADGCCPADHMEQLHGGLLKAVKQSAHSTFKKRNLLSISTVQFSMLAGTPEECNLFIIPGSWTQQAGSSEWIVARVDFKRYSVARHALCRSMDTVNSFRYARYYPLGTLN